MSVGTSAGRFPANFEVVMHDRERRAVVLGAKLAGGSVCALLREHGFGGAIPFAGDDPVLRSRALPCSNARLKGQATSCHPMLDPPDHYTDAQIDHYLSPKFPMNNRDETAIEFGDSSNLVLANGGA